VSVRQPLLLQGPSPLTVAVAARFRPVGEEAGSELDAEVLLEEAGSEIAWRPAASTS